MTGTVRSSAGTSSRQAQAAQGLDAGRASRLMWAKRGHLYGPDSNREIGRASCRERVYVLV